MPLEESIITEIKIWKSSKSIINSDLVTPEAVKSLLEDKSLPIWAKLKLNPYYPEQIVVKGYTTEIPLIYPAALEVVIPTYEYSIKHADGTKTVHYTGEIRRYNKEDKLVDIYSHI